MTERFRLEARTESGQNVLEYHDLDSHQLQLRLQQLTKLITQADWTYIDFEIKNQEGEAL